MVRIGEPWRSFKAKWILQIDLPIMLVFLTIERSIACGRAEYRTGDECCPMCSPGNRVYKHCTEFTSTSCVPCTDSTFLDEPNGLTACIPCTNCDPGFGMTVMQPCTPSSDTVCGTLEGFYCLDPTKDGCRAAQRHSSCKPGQYISHTGTTSTDTVCSDCTGDTYSDGSFTSCQTHTQCDTLKRQQIKPGTHQSDSECGPQTSPPMAVIIPAVVVVVVVLAVIAALTAVAIRRKIKAVSERTFPETQSPTQVSDTEGTSMLFVGTTTDSSLQDIQQNNPV
ncbi:tumor necrosis factor receptor superfamily member 14-like isoform X2 [Salmo trutta]|uniref:tumor necrosis factor receptor superfamily member 14-like isoform X2 n=1 Tax=Salmo trutta TaxID=8032 RepID=UPI0011316335|nr:tumor necrosis factor receptor superfamily member 14-like isoform X2 [Salmo trutta]